MHRKASLTLPRQYGGLVLSGAALVGTGLCYRQEDDWKVLKTLAWMVLAFIGLIMHEFRPYKR